MPIKQFICPQCGEDFFKILSRADYDATDSTPCIACDAPAPSVLSAPARRNPANGIQR